MKFTFAPNELDYVHSMVNSVLSLAPASIEPVVIRTFGKMRWKFTPNAHYVNLTGKERNVLASMLQYRLQQLNQIGHIGTEGELLDGLIQKVVG